MESALRAATAELAEAGIVSARTDAELLLVARLRITRAEVLRRCLLGGTLSSDEAAAYADLVHERAARVPLQHLTGSADFAGISLSVGPGVFVPRPETEMIVHRAITLAASLDSPLIVDLCTGCGAIPLALKRALPGAQIHAVELSEHAHAWAALNVEALDPDVDLRCGDAALAFDDLLGEVDIVTCNPPYIPAGAVPVDPEVRDHDPDIALYGMSDDGLAVPLAMAERAAELLSSTGVLLIEHAETQGAVFVERLKATTVWERVEDHRDLNDRPRMVEAIRGPIRLSDGAEDKDQ